jgi:hypothetical protein
MLSTCFGIRARVGVEPANHGAGPALSLRIESTEHRADEHFRLDSSIAEERSAVGRVRELRSDEQTQTAFADPRSPITPREQRLKCVGLRFKREHSALPATPFQPVEEKS